MPIDAATLVSELPPAAARPHATMSLRWPAGVIASTVTPAPVTVELSPMVPLLVTFTKLKPMAAPTCASDSSRLYERPVAFALASASCVAPTRTAPVPEIVRAPMTAAVFVISTQFTAIAAATPTLPPPWPDWPEPWLWPSLAVVLELGTDVVPVLLVFELPDSWLFVWLSALLVDPSSSCDLPLALA